KNAVGAAHSKLILVGEHAVVHGQPAISVPFPLIGVKAVTKYKRGPVYIDSDLFQGSADDAPNALSGIVQTIKQTMKQLNVPYLMCLFGLIRRYLLAKGLALVHRLLLL